MDGLIIRDLSKSFRTPDGEIRHALRSVRLRLQEGEILCVLGANGSGKTTLLKVLAGLVTPDEGSVDVAGLSLAREPEKIRQITGFSPGEERSFYGRLTGMENLRFFAGLRGWDGARIQQRLAALRESLALDDMLEVPHQQTSAGMKQRLSLARALLHEPAVLLLDEPTKSLDSGSVDRIRDLIRREYSGRPGRLALWNTHQVEEAWEIGSKILILAAGRAVAFDSPKGLLALAQTASPKETYRTLVRRNG